MPSAEPSTPGAELFPALRRLDDLLARAVERTRDGGAPAPGDDPFRGLYLSHGDVARSLAGEPGAPLGVDSEHAPAGLPAGSRLATLAAAFGLSSFDVDLLLIALAPEVDLRYERVYAYLQDDVRRRRPSVDLALSLLCGSAEEKLARRAHLAAYAPLIRHAFLEVVAEGSPPPPVLARPLVVDDQIVSALLGIGELDRRCSGFTDLSWPERSLGVLPLDMETHARLERLAQRAVEDGVPARIALHGRGGGQRALAEAIAAGLSAPLVALDCRELVAAPDPALVLRVVFRERWLRGGVLLVDGTDELGVRESDALAAELARDGGIVMLAGREPWRAPPGRPHPPLGLATVELRPPAAAERRMAWQAAGVELSGDDLDALAERFALTEAQIAEAAASALAGGEGGPREALFESARAQSAHDLAELADKISPSASWDELVLPSEVLEKLHELASWVEHRARVLGDWGFAARLSRGRGVTALFAGAAGTGKTLAAEVLAAELELDLYRIDLAGVVSKYIGETEKNLDRIFRAAEDANAVLFFDEADALFGKRSEVHDSHDRYANLEISYLLQKMETYDGVAVLATNLRENLDQAFTRRLAFIVNFPFPEEEERGRIWELVWPAETPLAEEIDFGVLAAAHRLSGGQIKNAALAAAYLAAANGGEVVGEHVESALHREYEKLGRSVRETQAVA